METYQTNDTSLIGKYGVSNREGYLECIYEDADLAGQRAMTESYMTGIRHWPIHFVMLATMQWRLRSGHNKGSRVVYMPLTDEGKAALQRIQRTHRGFRTGRIQQVIQRNPELIKTGYLYRPGNPEPLKKLV